MSADNKDTIIQQQLASLLGLYQHHLDLFLKWITIYSTVIGSITVYIFNQDINPRVIRWIPLLIAAASIVVSCSSIMIWSWLKQLQIEVNQLSDRLNAARYPSLLGIKMTMAMAMVTAIFAVANVLYSLIGTF